MGRPDRMADHLSQTETDYENELPNGNYDNIDDAANDFWNDHVDTMTEITGKDWLGERGHVRTYKHSSKRKLLFQGEVSRDDLFLTDDQRIAKQTNKICSDFLNQTWSWPNSQTIDDPDFSRPSRQSAHLAETISNGMIETQIEIITSGFEMIMTGYHPDVHV